MEKVLENKKSIALVTAALGLGFALATLNNSRTEVAGAAALPTCVEAGTGGGSVTDAGSVTKAVKTATGSTNGDSKTVTKKKIVNKTKTINSSTNTNTNSNQVLSDVLDVQVNDVLNKNEILNDVSVEVIDDVTDTVDAVLNVGGTVTGSLLN